jgi:hypothetical protein
MVEGGFLGVPRAIGTAPHKVTFLGVYARTSQGIILEASILVRSIPSGALPKELLWTIVNLVYRF